MSVVIKTANLKYKNSDGEYVGINAIAEDTIEGKIAAIENAGTTAVNNVISASTSAVNSIISASTNAVNSIISASTAAITSISTKGAEVLASIPNDYTSLSTRIDNIIDDSAGEGDDNVVWSANKTWSEITDLDDRIKNIYNSVNISDTYGENASYYGRGHDTYTGSWDNNTKTVTITLLNDLDVLTTVMVYYTPKFLNGHKYKIAIKWDWTISDPNKYVYIFNRPNINSTSNIQKIVNNVLTPQGTEEVISVTSTVEGYFGIGVRTKTQGSYYIKLAVYDVTDVDLTDINDDIFLTFDDTITLVGRSVISNILKNVTYNHELLNGVKGEVWSALGDSLTATGSGGHYLSYISDKLELAEYNNCGIGGTTISGAENANAMYQDIRINSLDTNSQCVTVMGGTNDIWQEYYKDHPNTNYTGWGDVTRDNHDVSTFCGAYNVLISKIFYKFCRVIGYYNEIDYTGISQVSTAIPNFRLVLITPPQCFYSSGDTMTPETKLNGITHAHEYVKKIAELWGLPCVDSWEMGVNDINKSLFFANSSTDGTHFNAFAHERLASLVINKAIQVSRFISIS